ncbi:phosphoglycerate kinase [Methanosarcinales archaeon]|nr:MAG: phosphoglycerate kinase [Methanosarcinales archaeon]
MFLTLSDVDTHGKSVLVRLDLNSPMDPSGVILDDMRFRCHIPTLKELEDAKVVIMAHQSRPGKKDFTTMEPHAKLLTKLLGRKVEYVDDIFGSHARSMIRNLASGEIMLLENVRFYSEETLSRTPEEHATTHMVRRLAPLFDLFVNDAFSASHRSHASIVGFTPVLTSVAGKLMETEIRSLSKTLEGRGRTVFVLGGVKPEDSLKMAENVLKMSETSVIFTGLIANLCLFAKGIKLGEDNEKLLKSMGMTDYIDNVKKILDNFGDRILLPVDFGVDANGKRRNITIEELPTPHTIMDIGEKSIEIFKKEIESANVVVMNGPAGVIENPNYQLGTFELLKAATKAKYSVIGGGHISAAANRVGVVSKLSHVSTGGGATLEFLSGEKLPGIEALQRWAKKTR